MNDNDELLTEARLATLLGERAERIEVHPDLASVTVSAGGSAGESKHARAWWAAVAAVVLVAGGAAVMAQSSPNADDTGSAAPLVGSVSSAQLAAWMEAGAKTAEVDAVVSSAQLAVWMEVEATAAEVEAVASALADSPAVERFTYVDRAAVYQEFSDYYADNPEILELVEPSAMPTYFSVFTETPNEVAEMVDQMPGVEAAL